jgi:hypothetical protein
MRQGRITRWGPVAVAAGALLTPTSAGAQLTTTTAATALTPPVQRTAHLIEWDLPQAADASPGAMVVDSRGDDNNRIWFVTRAGVQRVYRFSPNRSPMKGAAQWTAWELSADSVFTGGLRKIKASRDRRFVFVRASSSIQRVDTQKCTTSKPQTCDRTEWDDQFLPTVSDIAVDDSNRVFTTASPLTDPTDLTSAPNVGASYVQMLNAAAAPDQFGNVTVTRWHVGGGAGFCEGAGTSGPCVSGVDVHPSKSNLVYYSEPSGNNIGELNLSNNQVRRWSITPVGAAEPRQLIIDRYGIIWVVTGSGHLVNLDPISNNMASHLIPSAAANDPFGLAPDDDVVGYTGSGTQKVGMLFPKNLTVMVTPSQPVVPPMTFPTVPVTVMQAAVASGTTPPVGKVAAVTVTPQQDGTYVEAQLDSGGNNDQSPLGITPAKWRGQGAFFYAVGVAVGQAVNRVGFVRLPMPQKVKHPRDDDDTDDGCCAGSMPAGWHNSDPDDDDDDGLANANDTPTANENTTIGDPVALGAGQSANYTLTASPTTLALIATVVTDNPFASITTEIYNAAGVLVANSLSAPGTASATLLLPAAGVYTVRVKNYGLSAVNHTATLIVREPWPIQ